MADLDKTNGFNNENIDNAPDVHGVYVLYDGDETIYIGRAAGEGVSIRSRLRDHKAGRDGPCTKGASLYARERTNRPRAREEELLEWHRKECGRLPRCNSRVG